MANKYDTAIIDGQNVFFKSFSVHKEFSVLVDGEPVYTGGTFGFIQSLLTMKNEYLKNNGQFIVAWDKGYKRRLEIYPEYKANRNKDDWEDYDNFKKQRNMLQKVLAMLGISQAYKDGEEADDIVGTLSKLQASKGNKVIIMSADKDFQQLIDRNVDLLAHKGKDNIKLWNENSWEEVNGFHPSKFALVLGLMGDLGDNIPGVTGIGEKGAYKLVTENYRLLMSILTDDLISDLIPPKPSAVIKKLIDEEGQKSFKLSYSLALIDRNITGIKINKGKKDMDRIRTIFEMLKFFSLMRPSIWNALEVM